MAVIPVSHIKKKLHIGIVGPDARFETILAFLEQPDIRNLFPELFIAGVAAADFPLSFHNRLDALGIGIYPDHSAMLSAHPEINTLVLFTHDPAITSGLRQKLPEHISLLDHTLTDYLWDLVSQEKFCLNCQVDLFHAKTMLQTILDELDEDFLLLDKDKKILDLNRNVSERLGKTKEELLGTPCWNSWDDKGDSCREQYHCPFEKTLVTGQKAESVHTQLDETGRLLYYRIYTYPVFDQHNRLKNIVEIRRDITRRTYMEKQLQQSEKMATIGELSTFIAHEIKNPLFAVGGFANALLRSGNLEKNDREKVRIILEESKRLDNILKNILNFAKPTESKTDIISVNDAISQTMGLMGIGCEKKGIKVKMDLGKQLPKVQADMDLIKQCLINIVKNAIEHMAGGNTLFITTRLEEEFVLMEIEDTGTGIPQAIMDKVFNPFFTTKDKGSGLGLAMTKKIFEDLGGSVSLYSIEDKGTKVTLSLPAMMAVDDIPEDGQNA